MIEKYIPGTRRCIKCFKFGHHADACDEPVICGKCGSKNHLATACDSTEKPVCPNCKGDHPPNSPECPEMIKNKSQKNSKISNYRSEREEIQSKAFQSIWGIPIVKTPEINADNSIELDKMEQRILTRLNKSIDERMGAMEDMIGSLMVKMSDAIMGRVNEALSQMKAELQSSMALGRGTVGGHEVHPTSLEDLMIHSMLRRSDLGNSLSKQITDKA